MSNKTKRLIFKILVDARDEKEALINLRENGFNVSSEDVMELKDSYLHGINKYSNLLDTHQLEKVAGGGGGHSTLVEAKDKNDRNKNRNGNRNRNKNYNGMDVNEAFDMMWENAQGRARDSVIEQKTMDARREIFDPFMNELFAARTENRNLRNQAAMNASISREVVDMSHSVNGEPGARIIFYDVENEQNVLNEREVDESEVNNVGMRDGRESDVDNIGMREGSELPADEPGVNIPEHAVPPSSTNIEMLSNERRRMIENESDVDNIGTHEGSELPADEPGVNIPENTAVPPISTNIEMLSNERHRMIENEADVIRRHELNAIRRYQSDIMRENEADVEYEADVEDAENEDFSEYNAEERVPVEPVVSVEPGFNFFEYAVPASSENEKMSPNEQDKIPNEQRERNFNSNKKKQGVSETDGLNAMSERESDKEDESDSGSDSDPMREDSLEEMSERESDKEDESDSEDKSDTDTDADVDVDVDKKYVSSDYGEFGVEEISFPYLNPNEKIKSELDIDSESESDVDSENESNFDNLKIHDGSAYKSYGSEIDNVGTHNESEVDESEADNVGMHNESELDESDTENEDVSEYTVGGRVPVEEGSNPLEYTLLKENMDVEMPPNERYRILNELTERGFNVENICNAARAKNLDERVINEFRETFSSCSSMGEMFEIAKRDEGAREAIRNLLDHIENNIRANQMSRYESEVDNSRHM